MWIVIASIFYAFKITPELDKDGNPLPVDLEYEEFSVRYASFFPFHDLLLFCFCEFSADVFCPSSVGTLSLSRPSSNHDTSRPSTSSAQYTRHKLPIVCTSGTAIRTMLTYYP